MNGPRDCHAEGSKSEGEVSYDIPYMQNLKKMIQMNLFTKQKQAHRELTVTRAARWKETGREFRTDRYTQVHTFYI